MILIRNSPHSNGIYTFLDDFSNFIVKGSVSKLGIASLEREYQGYLWYFSHLNLPLSLIKNFIKIRVNTPYHCRLKINFFNGRLGEYQKSISQNKKDIISVIKHYSKIFPRSKGNTNCLHGDLSLGNVIFFFGSPFYY